ncbi:MAG TPA: GNAT family N-acetyltransferase, partial [Tepidisphaeraceae bacterium]|nr:GNAT family N-acetyltransferase [Tepidisphaeraceae bacterium]
VGDLGDDRPDRQFVVMEGDRAIGWVTSIRTSDQFAWVANLQVDEEFRRKGIGRALMLALLKDDAKRGIKFSILAASKVGSTLYPQVGYTQAGLLQVFVPPRQP